MADRRSSYDDLSDLNGISLGNLLKKIFPERGFVIIPWLRTGETAVIWAASGVGKTMLTLSLAMAIAGRGKVGDWSAPESRKVLYVDGEMHLQDIRDRCVSLLETEAVQIDDRKALAQNLQFIARQDQSPDSIFFDITNVHHQSAILDLCRKSKCDVLIIDNLSTVADGLADENEATAFRSIQSFMMRLKQARITTILVHHSRKDGAAMRGSTSLETTFEVILGLKKPEGVPPGRAVFSVMFSKYRSRGDASMIPRIWSLEDDGWVIEEDLEDELNRTVAAIKSLKYATQKECADALGISPGGFTKRVKRAIAAGRITRDGVKKYLGEARELREINSEEDCLDASLEAGEMIEETF